jgi:hypothetical protein
VRLGKKGVDALGHHRAHLFHLQQCLDTGVHQCVERAEMPGEVFGSGLADMADAQRKQKARQGGLARGVDGGKQIGGRLLSHPLELGELEQA